MDGAEQQALGGSGVSLFLLLGAEEVGDDRVDSNGKADGDGVDKILHWKDQGQGGHSVLADFGHKIAVHNVVQGADQHGQHHGQRHGEYQGKNGPLLHKGMFHVL